MHFDADVMLDGLTELLVHGGVALVILAAAVYAGELLGRVASRIGGARG